MARADREVRALAGETASDAPVAERLGFVLGELIEAAEARTERLFWTVSDLHSYPGPSTPVDELFELVVDSAFVGQRKPDPAIYAAACVFVDDIEPNCRAARELGLTAVRFESTAQAQAEVEAALADGGRPA